MPVMHDHRVENEQRVKQKLPMLYCPFGCTGRDVSPNPNGNAECCHLVGHTIDEKERVFEPLRMARRSRCSWAGCCPVSRNCSME